MDKFAFPHAAERQLAAQLRKVARVIGGIVETYADGATIRDPEAMRQALEAYSRALDPWARAVTAKILDRVIKANERAWLSFGKDLRQTLEQTPIGAIARQLHEEQVALIKTLPLEAAERAQRIAREAMLGSKRADVAAREIMATGNVTQARAMTIARTEIAKANATLTKARAQSVGATHYIWRTVGDAQVRPAHAKMDGKVCEFANPPEVEGEGRHGPGEIYNCRCYADPILDR